MRWEMYTDGATRPTNPGHSGYGVALKRGDDNAFGLTASGYLGAHVTNNQAEYSALIAGLELAGAQLNKGDSLTVFTDSKLVVQQVCGNWKLSSPKLVELLKQALELLRMLRRRKKLFIDIEHVPGHRGVEGNELADQLAGEAASTGLPQAPDWLMGMMDNEREARGRERGWLKLQGMIMTWASDRGHQARMIGIQDPEVRVRLREQSGRASVKGTAELLLGLPSVLVTVEDHVMWFQLSTRYHVDPGNNRGLSRAVNRREFAGMKKLVGEGWDVYLVHKPHGGGVWKTYGDMGWDGAGEVKAVVAHGKEVVNLEVVTSTVWEPYVVVDAPWQHFHDLMRHKASLG